MWSMVNGFMPIHKMKLNGQILLATLLHWLKKVIQYNFGATKVS